MWSQSKMTRYEIGSYHDGTWCLLFLCSTYAPLLISRIFRVPVRHDTWCQWTFRDYKSEKTKWNAPAWLASGESHDDPAWLASGESYDAPAWLASGESHDAPAWLASGESCNRTLKERVRTKPRDIGLRYSASILLDAWRWNSLQQMKTFRIQQHW